MAARLKNKPRVHYEPRSAHGRAVNNKDFKCDSGCWLQSLKEIAIPTVETKVLLFCGWQNLNVETLVCKQ